MEIGEAHVTPGSDSWEAGRKPGLEVRLVKPECEPGEAPQLLAVAGISITRLFCVLCRLLKAVRLHIAEPNVSAVPGYAAERLHDDMRTGYVRGNRRSAERQVPRRIARQGASSHALRVRRANGRHCPCAPYLGREAAAVHLFRVLGATVQGNMLGPVLPSHRAGVSTEQALSGAPLCSTAARWSLSVCCTESDKLTPE
jgi:hypothetical protein